MRELCTPIVISLALYKWRLLTFWYMLCDPCQLTQYTWWFYTSKTNDYLVDCIDITLHFQHYISSGVDFTGLLSLIVYWSIFIIFLCPIVWIINLLQTLDNYVMPWNWRWNGNGSRSYQSSSTVSQSGILFVYFYGFVYWRGFVSNFVYGYLALQSTDLETSNGHIFL